MKKNSITMDNHSKNPKKRMLTESDSDPDNDSSSTSVIESWPRFLIISALDANVPISKNPFVLHKAIKGIAGEPRQVSRMRSGDILVEVDKQSHSNNLLKSSVLAGVPVKVSPHTSLNTSKGVV
jgi:hypothetical protein